MKLAKLLPMVRRRTRTDRESAPEFLSISVDRLELIISTFVADFEKAGNWTSYAGVALSLWLSLGVSDFTATKKSFGLSAGQWQLIFFVAACWATARSIYGLVGYLRRPRAEDLLSEVIESADIAREIRAICLLKVKGHDHSYRILVYRDPLWDCFLLPHYNIADTAPREIDDPNLCSFVAEILGVPSSAISCNYITGADLRSRKHSEFHRQGTLYRFAFYVVRLTEDGSIPTHVKAKEFVHHGRHFAWMTISEMEEDHNTRTRNLDMTRHLADRSGLMLSLPPDSLSTEDLDW